MCNVTSGFVIECINIKFVLSFLGFPQRGAEFLGWFLMHLPAPGVLPDTRGRKEQYFDCLYTINRSVSEPGCACDFCLFVLIFRLSSGCVLGVLNFLCDSLCV